MWFKACPRCKTGDIELGRDIYGRHILCLQCGYMRDLVGRTQALDELRREVAEAAQDNYALPSAA